MNPKKDIMIVDLNEDKKDVIIVCSIFESVNYNSSCQNKLQGHMENDYEEKRKHGFLGKTISDFCYWAIPI